MSEPQRAQLRRTWLRGYRTSDVEIVLAEARLTLERLQHENGAARSRAHAMQTEIDELHGRIDGFRRREAELDRAIEELRHQRDVLRREAETRHEEIVSEAETRAATLRTEALRQVTDLQEQVEQLLALRANLTAALKKAGGDIGRTLEEVEATPDQLPGESTLGPRPADDLAARLQRLTRDDPDA
jgi:chromosome segregation ATPase